MRHFQDLMGSPVVGTVDTIRTSVLGQSVDVSLKSTGNILLLYELLWAATSCF